MISLKMISLPSGQTAVSTVPGLYFPDTYAALPPDKEPAQFAVTPDSSSESSALAAEEIAVLSHQIAVSTMMVEAGHFR